MLRPYVSERLKHRVRDLVERDGAAQRCGERGLPAPCSRLPAHQSHHLLRPRKQDRAVLQERPSLAHLCRADQLAPPDQHFPAHGGCEAGPETLRWSRAVRRERRLDPEPAQRCDEPRMNRAIARAEAAERRDRDRKSTRLNSSHLVISYAVFCLKKKKTTPTFSRPTHCITSTS